MTFKSESERERAGERTRERASERERKTTMKKTSTTRSDVHGRSDHVGGVEIRQCIQLGRHVAHLFDV